MGERLSICTARVEVNVVRNACGTGTNRPNKDLSTTSTLTCLCNTRVGCSTGGPGVRSESELILSGNRTTPTLCTTLTCGNFFPIRSLGALHRVNSCLRNRPGVGAIPNISVDANSLNRNMDTTYNVTGNTGVLNGGSVEICAVLNSNRVRRNRT